MDGAVPEDPIRAEIEFARALTAVLLAVRLEVAEVRAQDAYEKIAGRFAQARGTLSPHVEEPSRLF